VDSRIPARPDADLLSESDAAQLLARASELDATRGAGTTVADLRMAAIQAGISGHAFDAALAELHVAERSRGQGVFRLPRRRLRHWGFATLFGALVVAGVISLSQRIATPDEAQILVPTVEETIMLRCLSATEARELLRPLLRLRSTELIISGSAPRVITVRGTSEQVRNIRAALEAYESSKACTIKPGVARDSVSLDG
jgi:hypothetical protein